MQPQVEEPYGIADPPARPLQPTTKCSRSGQGKLRSVRKNQSTEPFIKRTRKCFGGGREFRLVGVRKIKVWNDPISVETRRPVRVRVGVQLQSKFAPALQLGVKIAMSNKLGLEVVSMLTQ